MYKYILKVYGMRCGMCESHINDVIRRNFNVKRVNSSHIKNTTTIFTEEELSEDAIKKVIDATGYELTTIEKADAVKKGLFWR